MTREYTVLVVDDDEAVVSLFESWLSGRYDVKTATTGTDALEELEDVDVALLDRVLPSISGDRIAAEIDRRESDCATAIVSAVEPDTDILDVHCSEYLRKPVTETELLDAVDRLRQRARYDDRLAEFADLAAKRGAVEAAQSRTDLAGDPEYESLCRRLEALQSALEGMTSGFDEADFHAMFETPDFSGESRVQRIRLPS